MVINNINDLSKYIGIGVEHLKRAIYKYTDCGAWIDWDSNGVAIGAIVEGSDAEFSRYFDYPFTSEAYENWLEELDVLTDEAWHEANDDEE